MGLIDSAKGYLNKAEEFLHLKEPEPKPVGLVQNATTDGVPPQSLTPLPDAQGAAAQTQTPTPESAAAAAQAHAGQTNPLELRLRELAAPHNTPMGVSNGRFDYETALSGLMQDDGLEATANDASRCGCESAVAAMLMRGPAEMKKDLASLEAAAKKEYAATKRPECQDLAIQCGLLRKELEKGDKAKVKPNELNSLADAMYGAFATENPAKGMSGAELAKMLKAASLTSTENAKAASRVTTAFTADAAAQKVFDSIGNGATCSVSVNNGTARPPDPRQPCHDIIVGKKPDGTLVCYDSGDKDMKNYYEGPAAVKHLASMPVQMSGMGPGYLVFPHAAAGSVR